MSSNNPNIYLKLNNYDYSRANLDNVFNYLKTGVVPSNLTIQQRRTFTKRYGTGEFEIKNEEIVYKPLNLILVCKDDAEEKMKPLYDDMKIGTGMGIKSFHAKVLQQYIGINRAQVRQFLGKQTPYQLTKQPPRPINKPVTGEYPNHRWEADLLDMSQYAGYNKRKRYILTVIDVFSKYVFTAPLVNKQPSSIIAAFDKIKTSQSNIFPVILQTDWGTEFRGNFEDWAQTNKIKIVHSLTHTPQTNGLVENFNLFLRKMIREGFVRTNSLNWIDYLQDYTYNRNHTKHSRLRHTPAEVWKPTNTPLDKRRRRIPLAGDVAIPQEEIQRRVLDKTIKETKKTIDKYKEEKLEIGDKVRIKLAAIDTKIRAEIKAGNSKLIAVRYTPEIYEIVEVFQSRTHLAKPQYKTNYSGKRFFASDLQRVDGNTENTPINSIKINKI